MGSSTPVAQVCLGVKGRSRVMVEPPGFSGYRTTHRQVAIRHLDHVIDFPIYLLSWPPATVEHIPWPDILYVYLMLVSKALLPP